LSISEPGGKTIIFKPSRPEEEVPLIVLEPQNAPHRARALYWDGSRWWVLQEAPIRSDQHGVRQRFDFNEKQEYTAKSLRDALDVLLE